MSSTEDGSTVSQSGEKIYHQRGDAFYVGFRAEWLG